MPLSALHRDRLGILRLSAWSLSAWVFFRKAHLFCSPLQKASEALPGGDYYAWLPEPITPADQLHEDKY